MTEKKRKVMNPLTGDLDIRELIVEDTSPPGIDDDTYEIGDLWINTATDKAYVCTDNRTGTAVWKEIGSGISDHTLLSNIGTNSHSTIDEHIANASIHFPIVDTQTPARSFCIVPFETTEVTAIGDGTIAFTVPASMNGYNITNVVASVHTKGITNTLDVQVRRRRGGADVNMLTTPVTIGNEFFAQDEGIDANADDLATGDQIYVDVDAVHDTPALGLSVVIEAAGT